MESLASGVFLGLVANHSYLSNDRLQVVDAGMVDLGALQLLYMQVYDLPDDAITSNPVHSYSRY